MRTLILSFIFSVSAFAANPFAVAGHAIKGAVTGRYGLEISFAAFGGGEAADGLVTAADVISGRGYELNPALKTAGVLSIPKLVALKAAIVGVVGFDEFYLRHRMSAPQQAKYVPWMIGGNWIAAGVFGGITASNGRIYLEAK